MRKIENRTILNEIQAETKQKIDQTRMRILICAGTGCLAGGSGEIYERMCELVKENPNVEVKFGAEIAHEGVENHIDIKKSGCHGFCEMGPLMRIEPQGILYTKVKLEDCDAIFHRTIEKGELIRHLMYKQDGMEYPKQEEIPFYKKQTRLVLKNCGHIDAEHMEEYIATGGYQALAKVLFEQKPEDVVNEIMESNLRGRGGGGFTTGYKWQQVARQKETTRYIVCNGDEGDPGAFMDRSVMEGDPHKMIEGMMIAAYAVGAQEGYIYVRAEYPLAISRLKLAIAQAEEAGLLGEHIMGSDFSFKLHINRGAGAFVCGEGSALTASIEGNRGMPRVKPPRTVEQGLFAKPTVLNNVETFANVPMIILNGTDWYKSIGPEKSPGTKAFALTGSVKNTGLIEVPMGTTLREVIFDIGGGIKDGGNFKAVQIGGPSGGCLMETNLEISLDFDSLKKMGAMIGSGGLVVMDDHTCMVEVARFFMNFTQNESCGKCVPCREGTKRMLEILERIVEGKGELGDLDLLEELATMITETALCGLGKSAALPVMSTLKNFRNEYVEHIVDKKCAAHVCQAMRRYVISPERCKGCSKCARNCPAGAISGQIREVFKIDNDKCIKCGACESACAFDAIHVEG
ncbi:MAG: NADH-ubiquinone oxidoreductase-F iron-sulfur binding region domain-containing protein [Hespellia sp.]|nr:NADH-ubiquinone oxidoreductase-F iron-sulfur binding region domain-containing protein [Hespellia sp.]